MSKKPNNRHFKQLADFVFFIKTVIFAPNINKSAMNRALVFLLGFIAGGITVFLGLLVIAFLSTSSRELVTNAHENYLEKERQEKLNNMQYVDVKGKNGEVTLHTFMIKDSVKILLGKPTRTDMMTVRSDIHETWIYEFHGQGRYGTTRDLIINFENGELISVRDY